MLVGSSRPPALTLRRLEGEYYGLQRTERGKQMLKVHAAKGFIWGALALVGCSADTSAPPAGSSAEASQAITQSCDMGLAYNGGTWQQKPLVAGCTSTTTFSFGVPSDIPLLLGVVRFHLLSQFRTKEIATYGTTSSDDRLGRFFIDRDDSQSWTSGDTNTRFMSSPLDSDQPFIINWETQQLVGGSCQFGIGGAGGGPPRRAVVGVKRGSTWYIDGNDNGTWDGPGQCDVMVDEFGASTDIPTPVGNMVGTSGSWGASLVWNFDADGSLSWSGAPPDQSLALFGSSSMRPFSDGSSQCIGAQSGTNVYLDKNCNLVWDGEALDIGATDYLVSADWRFVGWYTDTFTVGSGGVAGASG